MQMLRALVLIPLVLATAPAGAQQAVPSPADVLGYELGEHFTDHAGVVRYVEAAAADAPGRTLLQEYGRTNEGRRLLQLAIGRADHIARLDAILATNAELTRVETSEARAREIAATNPAIVYLSYGVHGNESSSSEAALYTIWDLLTEAPAVRGVLDSLIVIIDPAVNPDGRDRYVQWYRQARGAVPNPRPEAREHREPWPGGRYNHYLFDLNRDWTWLTQVETRARLATWPQWNPQVHVDFHEMSSESNYFFFPAAEPINPLYPPHVAAWGERFGAANAAAFDSAGWAYYTSESYDLFYPGYGDTWPTLLGAIGMTYEQAGSGSAGLAIRRSDEQVLTLRERAQHHRTTGHATLRTAAQGKTDLLLDFAQFHRTAGGDMPDILLVPGSDPGRLHALASLLRAQHIHVEEAGAAVRADAQPHAGYEARREFPAGTLRVPARQPRGLLAMTLLQPEIVLDATYSYDVSAWSLPYAYGVEAHSTARRPDAAWRAATIQSETGTAVSPGAAYGYVLPASFASWQGVSRYLRAGGRAIVIDRPFTIRDRRFEAGAIFLPRAAADSFDARIAAARRPAEGMWVTSGRTSDGPDLGTEESYTLRSPRVALVTGEGVSPLSAGAHWFFLDHTLALDYDQVYASSVANIDLDEYDVVVLPEMGRGALGDNGVEALTAFVRGGGTVVAVGSAARSIAAEIAEIETREESEPDEDSRLERALRGREARELEQWEERVPGTILRVQLDAAHPLAFGSGNRDGSLFVLHAGGDVFEPTEDFETVAHFEADLQKVSGVISERTLETMARSSWLATKRVGSGRVILFADDPLFRHFWYGTFQPYANALLLGPAL